MFKRTLCLLLTLLSITGLLPVTALAAEDVIPGGEKAKIESVPMPQDGVAPAAVYYAESSLYKYWWWNYYQSNAEPDNSTKSAPTLPTTTYKHIIVDGTIHSANDPKDYYKIKVKETTYLRLLCLSGHETAHSKFGLYNSKGNLLKSAPKKSTWYNEYGNKDVIYYLTYALKPGTYYIRAYEPNKAGYSYVWSDYSMVIHLYPCLDYPSVSTSNNKSTGKPVISWKSVEDAEYYKVYRASSKDGTYKEKAKVTGTSWTDKSAKAGKVYYYKVQAFSSDYYYDESNNKSGQSSAEVRTCDCARPEVDIDLKKGKPRLDWDEISGAKKYYIYRATSKSGEYKKIKSTESTSYTDTSAKKGKTYYYKVKACAAKDSADSAKSSVVSIKAKK